MKLRAEKINHIAHLITEHIINRDDIEYFADENDIRLRIKKIISEQLKIEEEIERKTRNVLQSYSRNIIEGSREWEILYQQTYEEEMEKRRKEF